MNLLEQMIQLEQPRAKPQYWQCGEMACKGFLRGNPVRKGDYIQFSNKVFQIREPLIAEAGRIVFATDQGISLQFTFDLQGIAV